MPSDDVLFTDADAAWAAELLQTTDARGVLRERFGALSTLLAILHHADRELQGLTLLECGARQLEVPVEIPNAHDPAIARFFALYGESLGVTYMAFDPAYEGKLDDEHVTDDPLRKRLRELSLRAYNDVVKAAKREASVLFSHHVLNDPGLKEDEPFWILPGTHVHLASFSEMCAVRAIGDPAAYERAQAQVMAMAPSDEAIGPRIAEARDRAEKELFVMNPAAHAEAFKRRFGLPEKTEVRCLLGTDGTIVYSWTAKRAAKKRAVA